MCTVPEDLLGSLILAVTVDSKPGIFIVSKVAVVIDAKASGAGTVRDGSGVGTSQADGSNLILDNVEALEASGSLRLGRERDGAVVAASADWRMGVLGSLVSSNNGNLTYGSGFRG